MKTREGRNLAASENNVNSQSLIARLHLAVYQYKQCCQLYQYFEFV